jgi:hypothetical protein
MVVRAAGDPGVPVIVWAGAAAAQTAKARAMIARVDARCTLVFLLFPIISSRSAPTCVSAYSVV